MPGAAVPWQCASAAARSPSWAPTPGTRKPSVGHEAPQTAPAPPARSRRRRARRGRRSIGSPPRSPRARGAACSPTGRSCSVPALGLVVRVSEVDDAGPGSRGTARSRPRRDRARGSPRPPRAGRRAMPRSARRWSRCRRASRRGPGTGPGGRSATRRSSAAQPAEPKASKKATLTLTATASSDAASTRPRANVSIPGDVARELVRQRVGVRVDPEAERRAETRDPRAQSVERVGSIAHQAGVGSSGAASPTGTATVVAATRRAASGLTRRHRRSRRPGSAAAAGPGRHRARASRPGRATAPGSGSRAIGRHAEGDRVERPPARDASAARGDLRSAPTRRASATCSPVTASSGSTWPGPNGRQAGDLLGERPAEVDAPAGRGRSSGPWRARRPARDPAGTGAAARRRPPRTRPTRPRGG